VSCYFTSFYSDENGNYSLSKRDVPLLISGTIGEEVQYAADVDVIVRSEQDRVYYPASSETDDTSETGASFVAYYNMAAPGRTYYCSEENFERYSKLLSSAELTTLCADWGMTSDGQMISLSETASRVILDAAASGDKVSNEKRDEILTRGVYVASFIACDSDKIVCAHGLYDVYSLNDNYYLRYDGDHFLLPDSVTEELTALRGTMEEYYDSYYYETD
ncbi:MAG: hypothetical protein IJS94_04370, partial [Clostridia bacterium]|nr:hypothetical protein [Clostridia bacterium]